MSAPIVVLGPQRPTPNLAAALSTVAPTGPVALITAGWRLGEPDIDALVGHVNREVLHLPLYAWFEEVMQTHPDLAARYHARQARIRDDKDVHRVRLHAALWVSGVLRERARKEPDRFGEDYARSLTDLRGVDAALLKHLRRVKDAYPDVSAAVSLPRVERRRRTVQETLSRCSALVIAGGHVAVLRNRMVLFGLPELISERVAGGMPVLAWSAGAMVLTRRVVLFYDDPPEGHGEAEVHQSGFGLLPRVVFLPHARTRMQLEDRARVERFAERFAPARCVGLAPGAWLTHHDGHWSSRGTSDGAFQLRPDGAVVPVPEVW